jgi:hypothetical protein
MTDDGQHPKKEMRFWISWISIKAILVLCTYILILKMHGAQTCCLITYNKQSARFSSQVFYATWIAVHMALDPAVPTTNRETLCIIVQLSKLHLINSGTIKHSFHAKNHSALTVIYSVSVFSNNETKSTILQTDSGTYIPLTLSAHSLNTIIYKT